MDRFWNKVEKTDTCWLWTAGTARGYGLFWLNGKMRLAHRVAYELEVGLIPEGMELDHVKERCGNRNCVNPAHLEPVTAQENQLRSDSVSGVNSRKTHCLRGHEFTEENTTHRKSGRRGCRACQRDRVKEARRG